MRLLAVDFVIQLCRARPTVAILAPRGQPFAFSFFLGFRAHFFFRGVGCQVTSCTQSRLLRAELFVKGSRHRLSAILRVVLIGRELVQFQHEKPFDCVKYLFIDFCSDFDGILSEFHRYSENHVEIFSEFF